MYQVDYCQNNINNLKITVKSLEPTSHISSTPSTTTQTGLCFVFALSFELHSHHIAAGGEHGAWSKRKHQRKILQLKQLEAIIQEKTLQN